MFYFNGSDHPQDKKGEGGRVFFSHYEIEALMLTGAKAQTALPKHCCSSSCKNQAASKQ